MAAPKIERWTEFWADSERLAVRAVVRPGVLALRAIGPYKDILFTLEIPFKLEGVFRAGTHLVTLPLLDRVLPHMPDELRIWVSAERPDWVDWAHREKRLHAARERVALQLATWSGRSDPPAQADLFDPAPDPVRDAPADHPARDLYDFQKTGVQWLALAKGRAILGDDMGLGKTPQLLVYCDLTPAVRRVLIVCPSVVTLNWKQEAQRWAPTIPLTVGKSTRSVRKLLAADPICPPGRWGLIVSWGLLARVVPELIAAGFDTVIADEIHNAKTPTAQRTRALHEIGWLAERRLGASGTEISNRPKEVWPLLSFVDPLAFPLFKPYGELYCGARTEYYRGREIRTYKGASRLKQLNALSRKYTQRREKRAVLPQLPPKRRQFLPLDPPAAFSRNYKAQIKALRSGEDDQAMGKIAVMRKEVGLAKVDAAIAWITAAVANGEPVIAFLHHRDVYTALCAGLTGLRVTSIVGATTQKQRHDRVAAFQAGEYDVIIGSMAMKEGVTLTRSAFTLHIERWWVSGDEDQSEDRACRIGQTRGVLNTYLHLRDSLDDYVHALIESKRAVIATVQDRSPIHHDVLRALLS